MKKICLIGCGKMGSAMLSGWCKDVSLDAEFFIVDPVIHRVDSAPNCHFYSGIDDLPDGLELDLVVLAVKPQNMADVLADAVRQIGTECCWLSIAAGLSTQKLSDMLGGHSRLLRAMPNTPAAIGEGITALFARNEVSQAIEELSAQLLGACGQVVRLDDEKLMDAVTALSGSGPAYVFLLAEVMAKAGQKLGLSGDMAMALAIQTIKGAGALMAGEASSPAMLRENVTSKGGTTAAALSVLMDDAQLEKLFETALKAADNRAKELDAQG